MKIVHVHTTYYHISVKKNKVDLYDQKVLGHIKNSNWRTEYPLWSNFVKNGSPNNIYVFKYLCVGLYVDTYVYKERLEEYMPAITVTTGGEGWRGMILVFNNHACSFTKCMHYF